MFLNFIYFLINFFSDFILFYFTILYWFCHTSATGIHVFPILNHPFGSSQCTSPKHPVSCIEPGLAIRFLYDITRFNAILPNHPTLSLSHRVQKTVLYICVSFAVSHTGLPLPSFKFHIYALVYFIGVFLSGLFHSA